MVESPPASPKDSSAPMVGLSVTVNVLRVTSSDGEVSKRTDAETSRPLVAAAAATYAT